MLCPLIYCKFTWASWVHSSGLILRYKLSWSGFSGVYGAAVLGMAMLSHAQQTQMHTLGVLESHTLGVARAILPM